MLLKFQLQDRARALKVKTQFDECFKALEARLRAEEKEARRQEGNPDGLTAFGPDITGKEYPNLVCGRWIATDDGVESIESSRANQIACYHPILPIKRMRNLQTGEEQIVLAFKRNDIWNEIIVSKELISNSRSIVALSKYGIAVTSETAKLLVRFLADIENWNPDFVPLVRSSSKLGWQDKDAKNSFLPYDPEPIFDAGMRFPQIINAIKTYGSFDVWFRHLIKIRSGPYVEPRLAIAAAFSSVFVKYLRIANIIIDFSGITEAGKTVMLMVAASIWACPDEGQYIGDFMTTDAELEARSDLLNNFPVFLDDSSKIKKALLDNLETVVYNLASGSGKKRSNKELGSERVRTWKTAFLINGEHPLSSYMSQGGAINRIIEVELTNKTLFEDPRETANIVRNNYGFGGPIFIEKLKPIDPDEIVATYEKYCQILKNQDNTAKQVSSLAAILTADEYAEKLLFHDGKNLKPKEVAPYLTDINQVSEGTRCYLYLMSIYGEKGQHFKLDREDVTDQWGTVTTDKDGVMYINFRAAAFDEILRNSPSKFSRKAFTNWAKKEDLLRCTGDRDTYIIKVNAVCERFISVKVVENIDDYLASKRMFT